VGDHCKLLPRRQGISRKILSYKPLKILTSVKNVSFTFKTVGKLHQQFDLLIHELLIRETITKLRQKHCNSRVIGTRKQTPKLRVAALKNLAKIKKQSFTDRLSCRVFFNNHPYVCRHIIACVKKLAYNRKNNKSYGALIRMIFEHMNRGL
jgi:hypothetical protein